MATTKADTKRRVVLPEADPGDVYDVQRQANGSYLLVRLERPRLRERLTREECLRAMDATPLRLRLSWEQLRELTREP